MLESLGVTSLEVRSLDDLGKIDRLIIPGGESTVISRFLESTGVGREIRRRVQDSSLAVYGTCAGAILLARKVTGKNSPRALGLIDIVIERNAYGTQAQSFAAELSIRGIAKKVSAAFIRAPVITRIGRGVEILSVYDGIPVLVAQGRVLAGTFHPEVRGERAMHAVFLKL